MFEFPRNPLVRNNTSSSRVFPLPFFPSVVRVKWWDAFSWLPINEGGQFLFQSNGDILCTPPFLPCVACTEFLVRDGQSFIAPSTAQRRCFPQPDYLSRSGFRPICLFPSPSWCPQSLASVGFHEFVFNGPLSRL